MKINIKFFISGIIFGFLPEIFNLNNGLDYNSKIVLGMTLTMVFFWLTEAIPTSITALIPIILSPTFIDITLKDILSKYASPVVFLLLGGFLLASGFEKSNLHQRLALKSIISFGSTKRKLLLCTIFSTAFFSMWLSNTATCLLMIPIIKFIVDTTLNKREDEYFSKMLILAVAYSASIGGMITPIGTIPNAILVAFLNENYNYQIDFIDWLLFTLPIATLILISLWLYFSMNTKDDGKQLDLKMVLKRFKKLGGLSNAEKVSGFVIMLTGFLWIFKTKINSFFGINFSDSGIAITCAFLFFIIPCDKKYNVLLGSDWFKKIPWDILILFGGGLSMASLVVSTGLAKDLSENLNYIKNYEIWVIIFLVSLFTSLITEFTSNTATTFLFLPIFASFAAEINMNIILITLPMVLAASCAFMMPISTPPNAIAYSSKKFTIKFMVKTGIYLNIISIIIITLYINFFQTAIFKT